MPAVSGKQYRFMQAAKAEKLKSAGPSPAVAEEFIKKTPAKKRQLWSKKGG